MSTTGGDRLGVGEAMAMSEEGITRTVDTRVNIE